jgi:hypothetical protein
MNATTVQICPDARKPIRGRLRTRGTLHATENRTGERPLTSVESLARARAARIVAERHLMMAIKQAEWRYEETAELGRDFDRRLELTKSALRDTRYLGA